MHGGLLDLLRQTGLGLTWDEDLPVFEAVRAIRCFGRATRLAEKGKADDALGELRRGLELAFRPGVNQTLPWVASTINSMTALFVELTYEKTRDSPALREESLLHLQRALRVCEAFPTSPFYREWAEWAQKVITSLEAK